MLTTACNLRNCLQIYNRMEKAKFALQLTRRRDPDRPSPEGSDASGFANRYGYKPTRLFTAAARK